MKQKIGHDKWQHFLVGIPMGMVLQASAWSLFQKQIVWAIISAFIFAVIICYGFELYSKFTGRGHYEVNDAIAGVIGGALGIAIMVVIGSNTFL